MPPQRVRQVLPESDNLDYIKYLDCEKYYKYKYGYDGYDPYAFKESYLYTDKKSYSYKKLEEKLNGHLFDCPNCARRGVKVSIDRDLLTDTFYIRAFCRFCDVYSIMQTSLFNLTDANFNLMSNIDEIIYSLKERSKDTSEVDLDAMIDKDWELAGG